MIWLLRNVNVCVYGCVPVPLFSLCLCVLADSVNGVPQSQWDRSRATLRELSSQWMNGWMCMYVGSVATTTKSSQPHFFQLF